MQMTKLGVFDFIEAWLGIMPWISLLILSGQVTFV
jgi:hypothetical protein